MNFFTHTESPGWIGCTGSEVALARHLEQAYGWLVISVRDHIQERGTGILANTGIDEPPGGRLTDISEGGRTVCSCGPGSSNNGEGSYLLSNYSCINHKVHSLAPDFHFDHRLMGAQLERAQSVLVRVSCCQSEEVCLRRLWPIAAGRFGWPCRLLLACSCPACLFTPATKPYSVPSYTQNRTQGSKV